jgi:hypothetical protein
LMMWTIQTRTVANHLPALPSQAFDFLSMRSDLALTAMIPVIGRYAARSELVRSH